MLINMYKLKVTVTGKKFAKYHYVVTDETGEIVSDRFTDRDYVACTIDGGHYFGQIGLAEKFVRDSKAWAVKHPQYKYTAPVLAFL